MKTTVIYLQTICMMVLIVSIGIGQSSYDQNNYLVKITPGTSQATINQTLLDLNSSEIWVSPVTNTRLWRVNGFPYVHTPNGNFITNINEQEDEAIAKPIIEETGLDYNSNLKPPSVSAPGGPDLQMNCHSTVSSNTSTSSKAVNVSIFDTGCSYPANTHPDYYFEIGNYKEYDYVFNDPVADDLNGHGTHVTSVIAHTVNKYAGMNGSPLPIVNFDVRKAFNASGYGNISQILLAFEEALLDGMQIANMSFSFSTDIVTAYSHPFHSSMEQSLLQFGALIICAAGNDSENLDQIDFPNFPAAYDLDNILSISSYDCVGGLAEYSNYGHISSDIASPGNNIPGLQSVLVQNNAMPSTLTTKTGTSQATSIITGVAAALATHLPTFDYALIKCAIINSATHTQELSHKVLSGGFVNADYALVWLLNGCSTPSSWNTGLGDLVPQKRNFHNKIDAQIYPNPTHGNIIIDLETIDFEQALNVEIYNITGIQVFATKVTLNEGQSILEYSLDLPQGLYFINLKNETDSFTQSLSIK